MDSSPSVSLLQGRFAYASSLSELPQIVLQRYVGLNHSTTLIVYCAMFYEVFATLLSNYFSLKSASLFHLEFSPRCDGISTIGQSYFITE